MKNKWSNINKKPREGMNKTEERYSWILEAMKKAGEIERWLFEPITFTLAKGSSYKPDFMVTCKDHVEFHEIKGSFNLDSTGYTKFKICRDKFPEYRFRLFKWQGKAKGFVEHYTEGK
jgi:hypothetical protein